jgi:hypothetical protein
MCMWLRLTRLAMASMIVVVLWSLGLLRSQSDRAWVRPLSARPRPVRILRFYATVGSLFPGQGAQLCYSVENAKVIRISPAIDSAYPSLGRCIDIHPDHTTHYTLQAEGFDGGVAVRSITLPVQDRPWWPQPALHVAWASEDPDEVTPRL